MAIHFVSVRSLFLHYQLDVKMTYCQPADVASEYASAVQDIVSRSKPSVRRRVVDYAAVRTDGAAPLVVLVGNARGQNPVHLHSSNGGAPGRVCLRCPAAPRGPWQRRTRRQADRRDGDERRSSLTGRDWRLSEYSKSICR